jgi:diguanylate cyclase (GGDEF)-like protein
MHLDMPTISAVAISVTAIIGFVLIFAWWREPTSPLTGWWGLAQLVMCVGIILALIAAGTNNANLHAFGQAWIIFSATLMWMAARQFEGRKLHPYWIFGWPAGFFIAQLLGYLGSFDTRLILACTILAGLSFAAARELSRDGSERLTSRWPAVVLLIATGAGYLMWLPLTLTMPIHEAGFIFASSWFPAVILIATLCRIALAFSVLAMVKERQELKQRTDALTDPLTGLPNRRALFEAAERLAQHSKYLKGDPISVLVFDLDHFKKINDTFGHRLGDRVLQLFAGTLSEQLESGSIVGRLGGEEFAAILPGANLETAAVTAEAVRATFAASAVSVDGLEISGTVSVGAAAHDDIDCDLGALFHRADGALYAAKSAGRNRVELLGPHEAMRFDEASAALRSALDRRDGQDYPDPENWGSTRRYRRSGSAASPTPRPRRGGPALS